VYQSLFRFICKGKSAFALLLCSLNHNVNSNKKQKIMTTSSTPAAASTGTWLTTVIASAPESRVRKNEKASKYAFAKSQTAKGRKIPLIANDAALKNGNPMEILLGMTEGQSVKLFGVYQKNDGKSHFSVIGLATPHPAAE
jgi:hypothetical protein